MRSEPGHTWGGSTLSGQRLQESGAMYEAYRSWRLPDQCRAAIIMFAARNRIRYPPASLLSPAIFGPYSILRILAMRARAASRDAGGAVGSGGLQCVVHQQADFRQAGLRPTSLCDLLSGGIRQQTCLTKAKM